MCSIFGFNLNSVEALRRIGIAGESRGTDATGVSVLKENGFQVVKQEGRARKFPWKALDREGLFYQGHTRATTQGNESRNYNNHPFADPEGEFTLTHNGIISNDLTLQYQFDLPNENTKIETDTYIAVQLIRYFANENNEKRISIDSVKQACEELAGSFALSIMTEDNRLFLLRHSNPCYILFNGEDLVYASTPAMIESMFSVLDDKQPETEFNTFAGNIPEDTIYEIDLDTLTILNKEEFEASSYSYRSKTNYASAYNRNGKKKKKNKAKSSTTNTTSDDTQQDYKTTSNTSEDLTKEDLKENAYDDVYTFINNNDWEDELELLARELGLNDNELETLKEIREEEIDKAANRGIKIGV